MPASLILSLPKTQAGCLMASSPKLLVPGTGSAEDNLPTDREGGFRMIQARYVYCALISIIITQLHLRSSGRRTQRWGPRAINSRIARTASIDQGHWGSWRDCEPSLAAGHPSVTPNDSPDPHRSETCVVWVK